MQQLSLFQNNSSENKIEPKNSAENYGIRSQLLNIVFNPKRTNKEIVFQALRHTYHGIWNIDIPHELYQYMNPLEIIALYCGVGIIKENNLPKNLDLSFPDLISKLVGIAFDKYKEIFPYAQHQLNHPHTINKGDLIKRMQDYFSQYPNQAQEVLNSFFNDLRLPHPRNIYSNIPGVKSYNDPNVDGKSIIVYKQDILTMISNIYKRNTKNKD
ncbi:MAG: hypothetical protein QXE31_00190 [Candidatus Woesearchaeota archaeon]